MHSKQYFSGNCRSFRTTSQKLALENYVLAYNTTDKHHAEIWLTVGPIFFCVFFVPYLNRSHKDTMCPMGKRLDTTSYIDQNVSQACQHEIFKIR